MKREGPLKKREKRLPQGAFRAWILIIWGLAGILAVFAIGYVWLHIQHVRDGYRLAQSKAEYEELLVVQRKLRLEWSQLQDPFSLEELGRKQFGLAPPRPDQKVLMH